MSEELESGVNNPAAEDDFEGMEQVPVSVVKAIREELKNLKTVTAADKEERQRLMDELNMYKAQMAANTRQAPPPKAADPFDGLDDDDVLTVAELKKIAPRLVPQQDPQEIEDRVRSKHADYDEVITNYLPKLIQKKPHLAAEIRRSNNPYQIAYDLATGTPEYILAQQKAENTAKADKAEANAKKPGSLSSVGGANRRNTEFYDSLSDDELEKRIARVKRRR